MKSGSPVVKLGKDRERAVGHDSWIMMTDEWNKHENRGGMNEYLNICLDCEVTDKQLFWDLRARKQQGSF